jgi:hypothetical protein
VAGWCNWVSIRIMSEGGTAHARAYARAGDARMVDALGKIEGLEELRLLAGHATLLLENDADAAEVGAVPSLSVCPSVRARGSRRLRNLSVRLPACLPDCPPICASVCLPWNVCLSVCSSKFFLCSTGQPAWPFRHLACFHPYAHLSIPGRIIQATASHPFAHRSVPWCAPSLCQALFLGSSEPCTALAMRREMGQWEAALRLAMQLDPGQVPDVANRLAQARPCICLSVCWSCLPAYPPEVQQSLQRSYK